MIEVLGNFTDRIPSLAKQNKSRLENISRIEEFLPNINQTGKAKEFIPKIKPPIKVKEITPQQSFAIGFYYQNLEQ